MTDPTEAPQSVPAPAPPTPAEPAAPAPAEAAASAPAGPAPPPPPADPGRAGCPGPGGGRCLAPGRARSAAAAGPPVLGGRDRTGWSGRHADRAPSRVARRRRLPRRPRPRDHPPPPWRLTTAPR